MGLNSLLTLPFVIVVILQISLCDEVHKFTPEEETCLTDLKLDRGTILKIHLKAVKEEDNEKYNTFLTCYFKKMGYIDDKGNIIDSALTQKVLKGFTSSKPSYFLTMAVELVVKTCTSLEGRNIGRTAVLVQNCLDEVLKSVMEVSNVTATTNSSHSP